MPNDFFDRHRYILMALLSGLILIGSGVSLGVGLTNRGRQGEAEVAKVAGVSETVEMEEPSSQPVDQLVDQLTNINTASVDELDLLPGIGPAYAQRIIEYRENNGPFKTISEIQNVSGIGPATFGRIKDMITVK